jgi:vacuolar-type H+-ATPase subunit I/STV1
MFAFQVYAEKDEAAEENRRFGMKVGRGQDFISIAMAMPDEQFSSALQSLEREFRKQGVSKFMSTLTPGAQNAINAGSFVWGYENAAKYVQNAMKLDEVKNAATTEQRSKAVVESVQQQSGAETKAKEATTFAWGYYNEDMKQPQAVAGVSETAKEKEKTREEMQQQSGIMMPLNAAEAVSMGLATNSSTPELLYCSAAGEAAKSMQLQEEESRKREGLERLEGVRIGEPRVIALTPEESRLKAVQKTEQEAEKRRLELIREHEGAERQLDAAIAKLDSIKDEREAVKKAATMLPSELARAMLTGGGRYAKRKAAKKKLLAWLAFSRSGKSALSSLSLGKLLKLASLSSLFR